MCHLGASLLFSRPPYRFPAVFLWALSWELGRHELDPNAAPTKASTIWTWRHAHGPQIRWSLREIVVSHVVNGQLITQRFPCEAILDSVRDQDNIYHAQVRSCTGTSDQRPSMI